MPAVLYSGEIESKLPQGLTVIDIKSLTPHTDLKDKYVQATVDHRYKHNQKPVPSLKLVLKNSDGSVIELLAIGQVADDLDICVQGDVLICLKFEIEACPGHYNRTCQMVVDDTRAIGSLVWIFKQSDKSKRVVQTKAQQQQRYSYKPLSELKVNTIVDVYGVVKFYKPPTKTKGSDYCCTISLIDPSFDSPDEKLSCNIFSPTEAHLPNVEVGNIIRFHRLKIQIYQGRKQGYNGPGFQWLLFRGSVVDKEASSASYTFEQHDEDKVKSLLEWWLKNGNTMSSTRGKKSLSEVQPKDYFDLVCQVIRVCDLEAHACKLCRVWDGTKFVGPLKMSKEEEFSDTVREDGTLMEVSTDLAVDVYLFDNHVKSADSIKPGDFIQLTNLHAALVSDQVELTLHGGTWFNRGVAVLSKDSPHVRDTEAVLNTIIGQKTVCNLLETEDAVSISMKTVVSEKQLLNGNPGEKGIDTLAIENALRPVSVGKKSLLSASSYMELNATSVMIVKKCRSNIDSGNGLKLLPTVSGSERNELTDSDREMLDLDRHSPEAAISISEKVKMRSPDAHNEHDPLEISSDSQSIWLSAYDDSDFESQVPTKHDLAKKADTGLLQDSNISSSGTSTDSQGLLAVNAKQNDASNACFSPKCSGEPNKNTPQSSQESFHTASGLDIRDFPVNPIVPETKSAQRTFLTLKRKLDLQEIPHDDNQRPLTVSKDDVFSLNSSVLCFDTVGFTENIPTVHSQDVRVVMVEETEANTVSDLLLQNTSQQSVCEHTESGCSQSSGDNIHQNLEDGDVTSSIRKDTSSQGSDKPLRCMLKTASTVVGHALVPKSSLKDVLEHAVPHKFRVLVRVQEFKPRPVSAANLVHFVCSQCHHIESAASLQVPLDNPYLEHVCPSSVTQSVRLLPTFIVTFVLCDDENSLIAYMWDKQAVQFFCGIEPSQILSSNESFHQVEEWLESLCPQNSDMADRPLLECCLLSYGTGDNVKYQIFDTVLV